ncbi:MAG: hypothetical protein GY791_03495 [Alphaproteobacteria bacterium]|nr:hypothetical protein [Alphaproteobacteria bacterium]
MAILLTLIALSIFSIRRAESQLLRDESQQHWEFCGGASRGEGEGGGRVYESGCQHPVRIAESPGDPAGAEAIFLSCGGIRSLEVAEEVERLTGKPVITSNQAQFWSCLRRAGIGDSIHGFGQIFSQPGDHLAP